MMYIEFMKNFLLGDSSELLLVRLISASWAEKRLIASFYTCSATSSWKIFFSPIRGELMAVRLISASWAQKRLIPSFLHMFCVEFMKNFLLTHSIELMAVRLISASLAQKRVIPSFYTCSATNSWKIFFSPIRASWWLLDSFSPPKPKNAWFLLSRHDVRRVHEKFFARRFERADGC